MFLATRAHKKSTLTKTMSNSKVGATIMVDNISAVLRSFLSTHPDHCSCVRRIRLHIQHQLHAYMPLEINNLPINLEITVGVPRLVLIAPAEELSHQGGAHVSHSLQLAAITLNLSYLPPFWRGAAGVVGEQKATVPQFLTQSLV